MTRDDVLHIDILEDGTIKTTTDAVSAPNHSNAEAFLRFIATFAGGPTTRTRRGDVATAHTQGTHQGDSEHERN